MFLLYDQSMTDKRYVNRCNKLFIDRKMSGKSQDANVSVRVMWPVEKTDQMKQREPNVMLVKTNKSPKRVPHECHGLSNQHFF